MANLKTLGVAIILASIVMFVTVIVVRSVTGKNAAPNFGIVIDAGSSHTGITLYRWPGEKYKCTGVVEQVRFKRAEEAMAKYKNETEFGSYLLPYIENTKRTIVKDRIRETSLYLGATAGMRLLYLENRESAEIRINTTRETLKNRSGLITKEVDIIEPSKEGLYAWISTNYLLDKLKDFTAKESTLGVLDMGGASAQIAFEDRSNKSDNYDKFNVMLYGNNYTVKASSNLCYGVDEARKRHILLLISGNSAEDPCMPKQATASFRGEELSKSVCLNGALKTYINKEKTYTFTGTGDNKKCNENALKLVDINKCSTYFTECGKDLKTSISPEKNFLAMSSYFYTTSVLNLTNNRIERNNYLDQANQFCKLNITEVKRQKGVNEKFAEIYCFQLMYIYHTLEVLYKFDGNWTNIEFQLKVKKTDLGWSLGYMIQATNAIPVEKPKEPVPKTWFFVLLLIVSVILMAGSVTLIIRKR